MVYLFNNVLATRIVYFLVFTSFTLNSVPHLHSNEYYCGFNDAWTLMKIKNLVEELKSNKKNAGGMINTFVDILQEGKNTYGIRFDLDGALNQIIRQIESQSVEVPKQHFASIRNRIQKRMKDVKCQLDYIDVIKDIHDVNLNDYDDLFYCKKDNDNPNKIDQDNIPTELVWGVCVSLTGIFLLALPIPICKQWGGSLLAIGVSSCATSICKEIDDKKK